LRLPIAEVKSAIFGHPEFTAFQNSANGLFRRWKKAHLPQLKGFAKDGHPKQLIEALSEDLLANFKTAPLVDAYGVYQHLMDYWADIMQDDCYLIAADGWVAGAQPREILQVKNKENKLVWPEPHDFKRGNRRFKSDLVPAAILIDRYYAVERDRIAELESELAVVEQELDEIFEEHGGEEGLLAEVIDGEGDKRKVVAKAVKPRLKAIGKDPEYADERAVLKQYAALLDCQADKKSKLKAAREDLDFKLDAKYPALTEDEVKTMVVDDKWLARLEAAVAGELDRVSQTLTGRIRQLAERYATPLPRLEEKVASLAALVAGHLRQMGATWK
jgi:type I restriction enzyme M protein